MQQIELSNRSVIVPPHKTIQHPNYPIHVGQGLVAHVGQLLQQIDSAETSRLMVIADQNAMHCHGAKLFEGLSAHFQIRAMVLPEGEANKTMATVEQIMDFLVAEKANRQDVIIAFGGGVTGDLAGFAASTYMRGLSYVHVPTTLLAQVDSSIGGKVGVNLPAGKNLMGSFHNPQMVVVDPELLKTLPLEEWQNGASELVKYGFTLDETLLELLPKTIEPSQAADWEEAIVRAIQLKVGVVARDPKESGERQVLNFGHTLGHGLEQLLGYGNISHGKAVALGMLGETRFLESERLGEKTHVAPGGANDEGLAEKLENTLKNYGLGISEALLSLRNGQLQSKDTWLTVLSSDKKNTQKGITLVRPSDKGQWQLVHTSVNALADFAAVPVIKIEPSALTGEVQIPASKSMSHRSLIGAALAEGVSEIQSLQASADIQATLKAIEALGAEVSTVGDRLQIKGASRTGLAEQTSKAQPNEERCLTFPCGESGSTLRFMIPVAMLWEGQKVFEGKGRLPERPLTEYLNNFDQLGLAYEYGGKLPLSTSAQLKAGHYTLKGNESSQYLTGLLMALPLLEGDSVIEVVGELESKDYVTLTLEVLAAHGIEVATENLQRFEIKGGQRYKTAAHKIEGDYSQAAFWVVAGLLGQSPLHCKGLRPESSQADKRLLEVVERMGGQLSFEGDSLMVKPSNTNGTVIDASQCPDLMPALAVLASVSQGETRIVNGQRLRIKESDRIKSTVALLKSLGGKVEETTDGMRIWGQESLRGGTVDSFNDHRIVMAAAAASVKCQQPVTIRGAAAVGKSYPKFFKDFASLGGLCHGTL